MGKCNSFLNICKIFLTCTKHFRILLSMFCVLSSEMIRHWLVSVLRGFLVLRVGHGEEVLQLPLQRLEGWSLHGVLVPALQHDVIQSWWTSLGLLHPEAMLHLVKDLKNISIKNICGRCYVVRTGIDNSRAHTSALVIPG